MYINMLKSTQEAAGAPKPLGERETWSKTGFHFRFTGQARLVVNKKGNRQIHSKKWSVIIQIVRWRDTVTPCEAAVP